MLKKRIEDDIYILTIENGKTNSLTAEFYTELRKILDEVNNNPSPKGIIFTGEGRFFSSGFDLPMFLSFKNTKEVAAFFTGLEEPVLVDLFMFKKPVIAALNGHTVAGGLIIAMACDYRVATPNPKAKYGMSEIKIGLPLAVAQGEIVRFGMSNDRNYRDLVYFGSMMGIAVARQKNIVAEVVDEPVAAPVPPTYAAPAEPIAPQPAVPQVVYVQPVTPPKKLHNRGVGTLLALAATVIFAAALTGATIPGGASNVAVTNTLAAGLQAKAMHPGAFVWADATFSDFSSTAANPASTLMRMKAWRDGSCCRSGAVASQRVMAVATHAMAMMPTR